MAENKSAGSDGIVMWVVMICVTLLAFAIGTYVGKEYSDKNHKIAALEPKKGGKKGASHGEESAEVATSDEHSKESSKEANMTDDQVAQLANEFVPDETNENPHEGAKAGTEHKAGTSNEEKAETAKATESHGEKHEKKSEHAATHETAKAEERTPSSVVGSAGTDTLGLKYTLQIASYPTEAEAQKRIVELRKLEFEASYSVGVVKGKNWYRVNVGTFASYQEAKEKKIELAEKGHVKESIIQKLLN